MNTGTAIILCAGRGSRLANRTRHMPKPLVKTNGIAFLDNALSNLQLHGITRVVVVVGYQAEIITEHLNSLETLLDIDYVHNPDWETTNNIYSLYLARQHITQGALIVEGDIFFSGACLEKLLRTSSDLVALVSPLGKNMEGTYANLHEGRLQSFGSTKDDGHQTQEEQYKTVNLYRIGSPLFANHVREQLEVQIEDGNLNAYYEDVFKQACKTKKWDIGAVVVPSTEWYEVDNYYDLTVCNYISSRDRLVFLQSRHGGYWRYPLLDFALIYNFHFPPQQMKDRIKENFDHILLNYPGGRKLIEESLSEFIGIPARHLCVANGAAEIIKLLPSIFPGKVLVTVPSFNEYANVFGEERTLSYHTHAEQGFKVNLDALVQTCKKERPSVVVIESPNNPTGRLTPAAALSDLASQLSELDIALIVDESFLDFSPNAANTLLSSLGKHSNLAVIRSMSKTFGIGGIRIGYLASANHSLLALLNSLLPIWNLNGFAEEMLLHLPQYKQEYLESCQQVIRDTQALRQALEEIEGITTFATDSNFVYCQIEHVPARTLCRLLLEHNLYIKECSGKRNTDSDHYVRISCRTRQENAQLINALKSIMQALEVEAPRSSRMKEALSNA